MESNDVTDLNTCDDCSEKEEQEHEDFINKHDGDAELKYACHALCALAEEQGIPMERMREKLALACMLTGQEERDGMAREW